MLTWVLLLGLPGAVGYALPARWAPWTIAGTAAIVGVSWLTYDGSIHNDPWPFLLTAAGIALCLGALMRLAQTRIVGT